MNAHFKHILVINTDNYEIYHSNLFFVNYKIQSHGYILKIYEKQVYVYYQIYMYSIHEHLSYVITMWILS